jgi:hypothetical protein
MEYRPYQYFNGYNLQYIKPAYAHGGKKPKKPKTTKPKTTKPKATKPKTSKPETPKSTKPKKK